MLAEGPIQQKNSELGHLLREARMRRAASISTCAALVGTSRRRYQALESGTAMIGAAELFALVDFLEIPPARVLGTDYLSKQDLPLSVTINVPVDPKLRVLVGGHEVLLIKDSE